ncbi:hypothetical protein EZS27_012992 [termite gut metagenome]|uniref:Porin n=1 Tax=termite gut metagenome TaxID=433724 RepID=A0A5J4S0X0_9ZZZZ
MGEGITATSTNSDYSINLRGFVQTQTDTRSYESEENAYSRFRIRRARLRLNGYALNGKISYRFAADFSESLSSGDEANGILRDAYISYNPSANFSISIGQTSVDTDSREMTIGSNTLAFTDRSKLSSAFSTIREVGIFADGTFRVGNNSFLRPSLSITDGDGSYTTGKRYGGLKYGSRLNYLPLGKFREYGEFREVDIVREMSPKVSIGTAFSYNDGTSDRRGGRTSGDILYFDSNQQPILPSYSKLVVDFLFKYRGFSLLGEYAKTWASVPSDIVYRSRNDGSLANTFEGGVENYVKGRMMLGSGFNLDASYLFPQLYLIGFRYTHLIPDENSYMNNTLYFNRNNFYEISAAKFLSRSYAVKLQASFIYIDAGKGSRSILDNTMSGNETMLQFMMQVSF